MVLHLAQKCGMINMNEHFLWEVCHVRLYSDIAARA